MVFLKNIEINKNTINSNVIGWIISNTSKINTAEKMCLFTN